MSTAAEGWYVDPSTGKNLRFWNGSAWTDEVAPLPEQPPGPSLAELIAERKRALEASTEHPAVDVLAPEVERTRLSRRELRARRGGESAVDDAPKHLPPVVPPVPSPPNSPPAESTHDEVLEVAIPAVPVATAPPTGAADEPARRRRVARLTVLLGILTVVSSVAVVTVWF